MSSILTIVLGALVVRHVSVSVCCCESQINYSVCIPWKDILEDKCLNMSVFTLGYAFITEGGVVFGLNSRLGNLFNCGFQGFFNT